MFTCSAGACKPGALVYMRTVADLSRKTELYIFFFTKIDLGFLSHDHPAVIYCAVLTMVMLQNRWFTCTDTSML